MKASSNVQVDEKHKQILKSALLNNYNDILKGQKMEQQTNKSAFNFKALALPFAALTIIAGGALGLTLYNGEITAKKAFAEAQEYYENKSQGRYLYQKSVDNQDFGDDKFDAYGGPGPEWTSQTTTERWVDTETGNERLKITNSKGEVLDESLFIDDKHYYVDNGQFDEPSFFGEETFFNEQGEQLEDREEYLATLTPEERAVEEFHYDSDDDYFPNGYKLIGFQGYEELEMADLSGKEIDDKLEAAGLPRVNDPSSYACSEEDIAQGCPEGLNELEQERYNTKPSEFDESRYDEIYGFETKHSFDPQKEYEICLAEEEIFKKTSKLDIFYTGNATPAEYSELFAELSTDDFFEVSETTWKGREVIQLSYVQEDLYAELYTNPDTEENTHSEVLYLNKDSYSLIGIESTFGVSDNASSFSMEIVEETYSDTAFDISTEGFKTFEDYDPVAEIEAQREELEAQGEDVDILIKEAQEFKDATAHIGEEDFGFGCDQILEGPGEGENPLFPEFDPGAAQIR